MMRRMYLQSDLRMRRSFCLIEMRVKF
ncbi:hypothetical protein Golax_017499 [Gossypium laxum]|uniref:Uncharacterized protein n=1 Tax=Gossypium laxum TaxID=34288 RepID=A0A7J8Z0L6_9ROSI|nr:hypothetical protein [Gossypium laxum]